MPDTSAISSVLAEEASDTELVALPTDFRRLLHSALRQRWNETHCRTL